MEKEARAGGKMPGYLRQLLRAVAVGQGLPALLAVLGDMLQRPVAVTDAAGRLLASHCQEGEVAGWPEVLALPLVASDPWRGSVALKGGERTAAVIPLGEELVQGYLVILENGRPLPAGILARARQMAVAVLLELSRQAAVVEVEKRYRNEFIQDLIYGNFVSLEDVIARGQVWGWDFSRPYALAVLEMDGLSGGAAGRAEVQRFASLSAHYLERWEAGVITSERGGQVIVLWPAPGSSADWVSLKARMHSLLSRLRSQAAPGLGRTFSAGIGRFYPSVLYLYRSYQEAKIALGLARVFGQQGGINTFDELGVLRLLYEVPQPDLEVFYRQILGPLEEYDACHDGSLVDTLAAYLASNGNAGLAAKKLFIHENTLRYRLRRIEEVLGVSLDRLEDRVNLFVAFTLCALRQGPARD
ncbi:MAG: hypothetical protein D9V47_02090 [Clostridia bacterium]|nr:MAG: hypothetical protein D9V47_02090 [Clostridia bacterium]